MTYQSERDQFIAEAIREGIDLYTATRLLRYSTTLQRLAIAQCNGDYPADNGERKSKECPQCGSGFAPASFVYSKDANGKRRYIQNSQYYGGRPAYVKICPDCRTEEIVTQLLDQNTEAKPVFGGDPRGAVLRLATANHPYTESGQTDDGRQARGLYVPAREV